MTHRASGDVLLHETGKMTVVVLGRVDTNFGPRYRCLLAEASDIYGLPGSVETFVLSNREWDRIT